MSPLDLINQILSDQDHFEEGLMAQIEFNPFIHRDEQYSISIYFRHSPEQKLLTIKSPYRSDLGDKLLLHLLYTGVHKLMQPKINYASTAKYGVLCLTEPKDQNGNIIQREKPEEDDEDSDELQ